MLDRSTICAWTPVKLVYSSLRERIIFSSNSEYKCLKKNGTIPNLFAFRLICVFAYNTYNHIFHTLLTTASNQEEGALSSLIHNNEI